jgi:5-formyltetrahydrofolate cyclo-ligase
VATTVHELQIIDAPLPMTDHDVPLDLIATPERVIRTGRALPKPKGIRWEELSSAQLAAMPVFRRLQRRPR